MLKKTKNQRLGLLNEHLYQGEWENLGVFIVFINYATFGRKWWFSTYFVENLHLIKFCLRCFKFYSIWVCKKKNLSLVSLVQVLWKILGCIWGWWNGVHVRSELRGTLVCSYIDGSLSVDRISWRLFFGNVSGLKQCTVTVISVVF